MLRSKSGVRPAAFPRVRHFPRLHARLPTRRLATPHVSMAPTTCTHGAHGLPMREGSALPRSAASALLAVLALLTPASRGPGRMVALAVPCQCKSSWSAPLIQGGPNCANTFNYCQSYASAGYPASGCFRGGFSEQNPRAWCFVLNKHDVGGSDGPCDELREGAGGGPDSNPDAGASQPAPSHPWPNSPPPRHPTRAVSCGFCSPLVLAYACLKL